jgi:hypothetical protein
MKHILFFTAVLLIGLPVPPHAIHSDKTNEEAEAETDSLEYELETFDAKFETWYAMQDRPSQYRAEQYYENWNQQYVNAWNYKATQPGNRFFETIVGYDPTVDYNFELDHQLFYYFQYVENVLNIEIMPGGPKASSFSTF